MSNGMDEEWKIDVKKAWAQPPAPVRERLRRIIESIGADSKRTYTARGKRLVSDNRLPVWTRSQDKNLISYGLNSDHPVFKDFSRKLSKEQQKDFVELLDLVGSTIPIDALFADVSSNPESVSARSLDNETFSDIVRTTYLTLRSSDIEEKDIRLMMSSAEPFRSSWNKSVEIIDFIEEGLN